MSLRWSWLRVRNTGVGRLWNDRRRAKRKKNRRNPTPAVFFEKLEDRLVLNGIPIGKEDLSYSTAVNTALSITSANSLLLNDSDPEGSTLTASVVANPANGTISSFSGSAGTLTYTPNSSYSGVDTFTYKVNDGTSDSDTITAAIAVGGHFGPRTNLEELPAVFAGGCTANTQPLQFNASCLTGDLEYAQTPVERHENLAV